MMSILIILSILFILSIIFNWDQYIKSLKIIKSRLFEEEDIVIINNNNYDLKSKSKLFLIPLSLTVFIPIIILILIILSYSISECRSTYIEIIEILLPLSYGWAMGDVSTRMINNFISKYFSIEELKSFSDAAECKVKLKEKHQYLSENEAEELNKFYFDSKGICRDSQNMFHSKMYEKEFLKRSKLSK